MSKGSIVHHYLGYFGHLMWRAISLEKTMMLEKIEGRKRRRRQDEMVGWYHQLNGQEFEQALGDGEGQGSLNVLHFMGSQRVGYNGRK